MCVKEVDKMEIIKYAMPSIAIFMDGVIKEQIHRELAQFSHNEFIKRYCELGQDFETVLN